MPLRGPGQGILITSPLGSSIAGFSGIVSVKKWFATIREVSDLYFGVVGSSDVQNEEILMLGNRENYLKNGNIRVDSERIKRVNTAVPPDEITFSTYNSWEDLSYSDIVSGSIKVFDSSESVKLQEGVDFEVNYKDGKIKRLQNSGTPGSASPSGSGAGSSITEFACSVDVRQVVKVHYEHYSNFVKGTDYQINYGSGTLSRLSSGSIVNGERVAVDYQMISNIGEQIITDVINQAHKFIMNRVSSELEGTENEDLKYAETYFALGLLSQASASDMLEAKRNNNVSNAAEIMLKLASAYENKAWEFLSTYLLTGSIRSAAGRTVKNLS